MIPFKKQKRTAPVDFVAFEDPDTPEKVVQDLEGKELSKGKPMRAGRAQKKAESQQELERKFEQQSRRHD